MLTPRFKLSEDENYVHFSIRAPYCSLKDLDVIVEDDIFIFSCKPYLLRLNLPGRLEDEFRDGSFDTETGTFKISYKKAIPGEQFGDLDLIVKLLCPKVEVTEGEKKITILSSEGTEVIGDTSDEVDKKYEYGFAMLGNYDLKGISSEFSDVLEADPFEMTLEERKKLRIQLEQGKFDEEHYLSDYFDEEGDVKALIELKTPYSESLEFTDKELDFLKDFQNVEYKLNDKQLNYCHNSLIDILFAYCYDRRTTHFEGTIESGWTIVKIAASFSWLDGFESPKEALICAFRRAVIYPLYRNFSLCEKVFQDLLEILSLGEQRIIKCLIEMNDIFLRGDCCRYILNNLFIKHYIRYIMKWDKEAWKKVVDQVKDIVIKKEDLGLNLTVIEHYVGEDAELNRLMLTVKISNYDSDDSSFSSSSSSDSDASTLCSHSGECDSSSDCSCSSSDCDC